MTRDEVQALAAAFQATLSQRHPATIAALYAPDSVVESPMFATLHGRKAIEESYRQFFAMFPDMEFRLESLLIDPPGLAITTNNVGTQEGDFFGLPPTHKRIEFLVTRVIECSRGLIARERRIYDYTGVLVQAGVLRARPAKA